MKKTTSKSTISCAPSHMTMSRIGFTAQDISALAKTCGVIKRAPRKIDPCRLLDALCEQCQQVSPSYNDLALHIASNQNTAPSRQAIGLRFNEPMETLIQTILESAIKQKLLENDPALDGQKARFRGYKRVLVQDSTIIKLPARLFEEFSGVSNGKSRVCNARMQAVYDLLNSRFVCFSIDPYSKNDLRAAPELVIQPGDLVLRDRGYLIPDEIQRHIATKADCIYRHITGTVYLDPVTLTPINLPDLLALHGRLDMEVCLNNDSHTRVRLIAAPVKEETANLRRMKAKKQLPGHNPSKAVLHLMSWTIFITTISVDRATFEDILAIYGLRWRIEMIFKAWKSHAKVHVVHNVAKRQLMILLKIRLLLIVCGVNYLYSSLRIPVWKKFQRRLSLIKLTRYLCLRPENLLHALCLPCMSKTQANRFLQLLSRYCCYDKRKRLNFTEKCELLA